MSSSKTQRVNFRLDPDDQDLFKRAAQVNRESMTQFIVESGRERAERLLADRTTFRVDDEAWRAILAALDEPAKVHPELVKLFSQPDPE